jgi:sorbitol-specific phosphotransferase system component IIA
MIFVAVGLVTMLAFVGLTIDAAHAFVNHRQMQTAADAAALAGAYDVVHGNPASVAADANTYAHNNGYNGPTLHQCTAYPNVTDTNCWAYPYVDNTGKIHPSSVEVRIHAGVTPFFAPFIHLDFINVHTRAVASLAAGQETPQYSFVALQSDGENHTLLVKNSSTLNVANSLYTDSCGGMIGCQGGGSDHDSFDVFGTGGTITDAKDIFVVGGWETHDGDFVGANGSTCLLGAGPYTPNVKTAVALTTGTTSFKIAGPANGSAGPVNTNDVIQIENEQMLVNTVTGTGANVTLGVTRGYNSTTIATHANNTVINKVGVVPVNFNPSISTPAGGIDDTVTTFNTSVAPTAADPGDVIQINTEQMLIVAVGANSLTVQRAYNGTTAAPHAGGVVIQELEAPTSVFAPNGTPSGGNCPTVGQPYLPDPFALFPGPPLGSPAWTGGAPVAITQIKRVAGVATADTSTPDGFTVGDPVLILAVGPDAGFNGTYTVTGTPSTTEFTYANPGTDTPSITGEKLVAGVATATTNTPFTIPGGVVTVTVPSLSGIFNAANKAATVTGLNSFSYNPPPFKMNVTKEQLQGTTVTLTVSATGALAVGDTVSVTGLGSPFNGSWAVASLPGGNTFTYTIPSPGPTTYSVTKKAISGTTATLTTNPANGISAGDQITVATGDSRFDGTFPATAGGGPGGANGGATVTYTIPAVTATVTNKSAAAGKATLTTSTTPFPFESGDTVSVSIGRLAYDSGSVALSAVSSGAGTFSYNAPTFQNSGTPSWTWVAGTRTVTMMTASATGLRVGDTVVVKNFAGAQGCFNQASVAISAIGTNQFSYVIPGAGPCTPTNTTQQGTFSLIAALSTAATGTATLTTYTSAANGNFGTVTGGPGFMPPTNVTCNNCVTVTDVPPSTAIGTFSPAWMPAAGQVGNAKGTSGAPSPDLINSAMTLHPGTYYGGICLGSANGVDCAGTNCATPSSTTAYSPAVQTNVMPGSINATQTNIPIKWTGAAANPPDPVSNGDTIQIDSEQMAVTNVGPPTYSGGGNKNGAATLTVTRAANGTTGATHNNNIAVNKVLPPPSPVIVTMEQGQYIMAGGGFHVCGSMSLDAPNVLIYNTNDPSSPATTYGKVGQVEINTTGTVTLGPQTLDQDPLYAGFTIFGDRGQVVDPPTFKASAYNPAQTLTASISSSDTFFNVSGTTTQAIYPGNVICFGAAAGASCQAAGDELMMVTAVTQNGATSKITVTRGYDGTTPAAWSASTSVKSVTYGGDTCDSKAGKALGGDHTQMDISFLSAGNPPGGFPLDNISGTIYQAGPRADFENAMFGDANLAVISSCIFIDGGAVPPGLPAADFEFNPGSGNNIAGVTESLSE